ncbi:Transporter of the ATP-binding cassette (ABC) [Coemansia spiralis]|uniref:Transporter of the ATP-binding cassette (ABC) n=2 Tax=Coemansia TaxID=4863 RepID=A0A9W8GD60_9FUNG|nr:Transporter of the ATP-binding cassette (ABC) [Coemansia umbellata]KAJ2625860.1 Transporter of the ATP-binding cassette (ABC) [Coemansia sp. RSA 1358]KAJ2680982.1 Transporter of the ATP-binding cassette (ABC) [Coemansia spiralis]
MVIATNIVLLIKPVWMAARVKLSENMLDTSRCTTIPWNHPWLKDDFDPCFRKLVIETTVPAIIVAASAGFLLFALVRSRRKRLSSAASGRSGYFPLLGNRNQSGSYQDSYQGNQQSVYGATTVAGKPMAAWDRRISNISSLDDSDDEDDEEDKLHPCDTDSEEYELPAGVQAQIHPPPSIRDLLLVILTAAQLILSVVLFRDSKGGETSLAEVFLWLWATALCGYLFYRSTILWPSPSPHLRFVYTSGLFVDAIKMRTVLLAYSRSELIVAPVPEVIMAAVASVLFFASFTQQRRRHGLPSYAPVGTSNTNPPAPEKTASIAQLMFFSWMDPMIWLGYKRPLEPNDVYDLMPDDHSARVCARWRRESREYVRKNGRDTRSLTHRMFWFFRYRLALQYLWTLGNTVFIFTGPFLLKRILAYMEDPTIYTREQAFWCVAGLLGGGTIVTVCQGQALWIGRKIGIQIKSIIIGEVYAKSLRRRDAASSDSSSTSSSAAAAGAHESSSSEAAKSDSTANKGNGATADEKGAGDMSSLGKITNLMAVDAHKISEFSAYLHLLFFQLPAEIIIAIVMLYQLLGIASIAGLCAIIALVPLQWRLVSVWSVFQDQLMKVSDRRMSMTNEILQGVRIIKFFAWEPQFEKQVAVVRGSELSILRKRYLVLTYSILVFFMAPVFITLATFGVHTMVMGRQLTASIAFTALALFKTLRGPMDQLPDFFSFCLQAKVSLDRVAKFLAEEETPKYELSKRTHRAHNGFISEGRRPSYAEVIGSTDIGFVSASFSWRSADNSSSNHASQRMHVTASGTEMTIPTVVEPSASEVDANIPATGTASDIDSSEQSNGEFQLCQLTVSFPVGKLSIIAGPTGCGKTSMLMALLGEMRLTAGQVMVPGAAFNSDTMLSENPLDPFSLHESVAYVAQQAWLLNDTIRGNITFGLPFNEQRYNEVVRMCALARDFEVLDGGDMTEVGERGVALSGGQKQRICLARAVYSPARHVVMDDCLSAVDAHTAKHLFDNCLMAPYMADRTRILVTHAVGLTIKGASMVVVMQDGRIAASGLPAEVLHSGKLSEETLREADEEQQNAAVRAETKGADKGKAIDTGAQGDTINKLFDGDTKVGSSEDGGTDVPTGDSRKQADGSNDAKGKLTTEEGWSRGHVQWRVYAAYFKASGGMILWIMLLLLFLLTQGLMVAQDWWLRQWVASYQKTGPNKSADSADRMVLPLPLNLDSTSGSPPRSHMLLIAQSAFESNQQLQTNSSNSNGGVDLTYFIGFYILIAVASTAVILGRSLVQFWASLKASKTLHERLLHTVLRAPVRFFDITPVGRLINRFSKDMETIDQALSSSLAIFMTEVISSLAILVVIAVITPQFTLGAILIAGIYWIIGMLYLSASREIKRFESVTKSPIYTQFGETLNGVSTIRAYGQERRFRKTNYKKIDDNIRPFIYMWGANRWLSIRVDLAGALVSFMAGLLALMATGRMDAGLAGLSLSYALNFTEHILWVVRFYSVNEMNLNSVERVVEYLDVEPEAPVTILDRVPSAEWPTDGRISVEDLVLRYAENLPPVIRGISFKVNPREKVGIVGRTGAGKSTLTLAMFRFMEASAGRIVVDGVDISHIGVGDLRSRLTIIPQDPVLFAGTIRSNLDPFNEHRDEELWLALRRAHLLGDENSEQHATGSVKLAGSSRASIISDDGTAEGADSRNGSQRVVTLGRTITDLEMVVVENGSNFSQGQRQLIALARALVKRTRVIILDEATASVDFDTDAKIQATIRTEFTDSTLLCIAHRLRTIVDYDKVLVLDHGEVVEYDTPYNLLSKDDGLFKHMCLKSGEYDYLFASAERKHHSTEAPQTL